MADRERRSSTEDNLSDESDSNVVNLYDSDVINSVVPVEQSRPRPYQFEPRRVRQNDQQEASPESYDKPLRPSWKHRLVLNHFAIN